MTKTTSQETRNKIATKRRGQRHSPETIQKIKEAHRRRYSPKAPKVKPEPRGTTYVAANRNWKAQVRTDGRTIYLGSFPTEQGAHEAYLKYLAARNDLEVPPLHIGGVTHGNSKAQGHKFNLGTQESQGDII